MRMKMSHGRLKVEPKMPKVRPDVGTEGSGGEHAASKSRLGDATTVELTDREEVESSRG
jgi:hypothetical protein